MEFEFSVRIALPSDAHAVFGISEECFSGAEKWSEKLFQDDLSDASKHYFVAYAKDGEQTVIAFAGYAQILDEAHIMDVAVLSKYRAVGVATELLQMIEKDAKMRGITAATLEMRVSNIAAKSLYRSTGFVSRGVRKGYYPDKEGAEIFWKEW